MDSQILKVKTPNGLVHIEVENIDNTGISILFNKQEVVWIDIANDGSVEVQQKSYNVKTKFTHTTIKEFNQYYDTELNALMTFAEAIEEIEKKENNYFYASMDCNNVIEAIENNKEIADQLQLNKIYIEGLGIFIALQP
jgi:predicted methyltransferase